MTVTSSSRRDLDVLLGDSARDLVGAVLDAAARSTDDTDATGVRSVRPAAVTVRPSGATLVRYAVELNRRDGSVVRETLVAATGSLIPDGAAVVAGELDGEPMKVGLWRWPHDPALPALAHVVDRDRLRTVLAYAGITPTDRITVHIRAYRPARRAVLAITAGPHRLFAKIVPPASLPGLRTRHELVSARLPAPELLATTDDGLALMPALPGSSARAALRDGHRLPDAETLEDLLDRLPADLTTLSARTDHRRRARHYAAVLALTALPEEPDRSRVAALADAISEAGPGEHPMVPVHGDFYDNQLLLREGTVTGLLDIDTAGPGHRLDDWATFLAHLAVLDTTTARGWARAILRHVETRFAPDELRPRVASAVLGLATGPFRTQRPDWAELTRHRVAVAEQWLNDR